MAKEKKAANMKTSKHLTVLMALLVILQMSFVYFNATTIRPNSARSDHQLPREDQEVTRRSLALHRKHSRIASYWWPSPESSGGFLAAIHRAQHTDNCSAKSTKYFVLRSLKHNKEDNRGLSAWASVTMHHMLHAFSDGDNFTQGGRILINDDALWPMAKGCKHGPETRECYFLPFTNCNLSDVDPIDANDGTVAVLTDAKDEYNRTVRTLYSSDTTKYARTTNDKISWSGLQGGPKDYSLTSLIAAFLAYNLQPQPWLRKEIDQRLRRSLPSDLDPDKTLGVPIRRSDKCHGHTIEGSAKGELNCPDLEAYISSVKRFMTFDPSISNIIVTSEDSKATAQFISMVKTEIPELRIITNVGDVQQGTGSASKLESYKEGASNADVIASALTSMHLHLRARYFVLTTKSTWTSSIAILARVYGFAPDIYVIDIGPTSNTFSLLARTGG
ncbi:hypothetical protein HJC23_002520 [Cyclotella cryptica]|uniref:Fucosyltransferase n=1 Tax=Cyclotella cryptica TaxID=29204 RepID=A0ABD3QXD6_9STRA|eukprot:CCRYP_001345-RA/>CCRYP_001345-RA protein AED:0.00 eAED:0.00 QI:139/-1/1/1/-1/1/1/268/445